MHYIVQPRLVDVNTAKVEWQRDVLERGERRDEVVGLEDKANLLTAQDGEFAVAEPRQVGAINKHFSRGERVEAGEAMHEGALA